MISVEKPVSMAEAILRPSAKNGVVELRRRKNKKVAEKSKETQVQKTEKRTVWQQLTTPWLLFRYCVGFLMGLLACIGSIVTYQKDDATKEYKFTAWLVFALIGLCFHETRPFKRF